MVRPRRGLASMGCLLTVLLTVIVAYVCLDLGEVYWRYYQFSDAMRQEARFATSRTDAEIVDRLRSYADSLGLPEAAGRIRVRRTPSRIVLGSSYVERVRLLRYERDIRFAPRAETTP